MKMYSVEKAKLYDRLNFNLAISVLTFFGVVMTLCGLVAVTTKSVVFAAIGIVLFLGGSITAMVMYIKKRNALKESIISKDDDEVEDDGDVPTRDDTPPPVETRRSEESKVRRRFLK